MRKSIKVVSLFLAMLLAYGSAITCFPAKSVFADEEDVEVVEPVIESDDEEVIDPEVFDEGVIDIIDEDLYDISDDEIIVDPADLEDYSSYDEYVEDTEADSNVDSAVDSDVDTEVDSDVEPETEPSSKEPEEAAPKTQIEMFVTRCYEVALGRTVESGAGFEYWRDELRYGNQTGVSLVYNFFNSVEYKNKNKSNADYVKDLYKAFMGRSVNVNAGGPKYWVDQLNTGESRESVFAGFANSVEFYNICKSYGVVTGTYMEGKPVAQVTKVNLFVNRLYEIVFQRSGDKGGVAYWTEQLVNRKMDGARVAYNFLFGPEYRKLGKRNSAFVSDLYEALMDRCVEVKPSNYWMTWLNEDAYDIDLFNAFIASTEFTNICNTYGIVRGNTFDKFSMEYESCFARDTSTFNAPKVTSRGFGGNYVDFLFWELVGFHGTYLYSIYLGDEVVDSTYSNGYSSAYVPEVGNFISRAGTNCLVDDDTDLIPAGNYRVVLTSTKGYVVAKIIVAITQDPGLLQCGEHQFLDFTCPIETYEQFFNNVGGFYTEYDAQARVLRYAPDGHYPASSTSMSFYFPVDTSIGVLRYQWYYSPDGNWANRQSVGLSGNVFAVSIAEYNHSYYYYQCDFNASPTTIPRGTYWCVLQDSTGNDCLVARCEHD